jgi:hypothetical protein
MKLKQLNHAPSSPTSVTDVGEDQLRNHLQHALNELPSDLLKYNQGQLLGQYSPSVTFHKLTPATDDLCFLLRSPLLLYAMGPRLRRAKQTAEASRIRMLTPESMSDGIASPESKLELDDGIDTENLNMDIQWDGDSWVTRLMFGNSTLVEGRQRAARKAGFSQSFRWFCDETRFLCYEFGAREQAAAVRLGSAMDTEPLAAPKGVGKAGAVKKSRIVKLKIGPTRVEAGRGARTK